MSQVDDALGAALEALRAGLVVAIPTDTLYGLAVRAEAQGATARLFAAKRRPHDVDLPVLCADAEQAARLADGLPPALVEQYWPGALTIVARRAPSARDLDLGASATTVGVRVPAHELVRDLARTVGPLATTSANHHGEPTPPTAAEIRALFTTDEVAIVVDGGRCEGAASTVIDCTTDEWRILREGAIPAAELAAVALRCESGGGKFKGSG